MGNFKSNNRDRGFSGNRSSGGSRGFRAGFGGGFGGRGGGRGMGGGRGGGFGGRDSNRRFEMHEVTCDKCGKQCEVPFKPSGDKPVFCSDCFRKEDNGSGRRSRDNNSSSGISQEQFKEINTKLDKILEILEQVEFEDIEDDEDSEEDSEEESKSSA